MTKKMKTMKQQVPLLLWTRKIIDYIQNKCDQCQPKLRSSWGTFCISFFVHFRMLRHADRLIAKIPAMDADLRNCTLKETRRAAWLEWLSRMGLKWWNFAKANDKNLPMQKKRLREIVHLKKRGALYLLNGCPGWDSNDENLLTQTTKICRCKRNAYE